MELLFETRTAINDIKGRMRFFQEEPQIMPEPVMKPVPEHEGGRVTADSVIYDGNVFKMWYRAFPDNRAFPAYAESQDGINWHRPDLDITNHPNGARNFLELVSPVSVFLVPDAELAKRYQGVGYVRPGGVSTKDNPRIDFGTFQIFYSADGLHWDLEPSTIPRTGDTITGAYHYKRKYSIGMFKKIHSVNGLKRRTIWTAPMIDGKWSEQKCSLVPGSSDDLAARERGACSADYYRMGMLPAGNGCVGFIETFWHTLPYSMSPLENYAIYGFGDITLAYQEGPGDRWLNMPVSKSFIRNDVLPWTKGWIQPANMPVEVGGEHWLYFTGSPFSHAMHLDVNWNINHELQNYRNNNNDWAVGIAKWPKWRLFGFSADPEGILEINLGKSDCVKELFLNFKTKQNGCIRVGLKTRGEDGKMQFLPGFSVDDAVSLSGDCLKETVKWKNESEIPVIGESDIIAEIHVSESSVYAWEF